jgi:AraC-like DNA-binding protein
VIDPVDLAALLVADPDAVPLECIPDLIGEHERRKALLLVRLMRSTAEPPAGRDRVLPVTEVATQLGVAPREVRRLFTRPGGLPHVPLGPKTKGVLQSDLDAFLVRCRRDPPLATSRRGRGRTPGG